MGLPIAQALNSAKRGQLAGAIDVWQWGYTFGRTWAWRPSVTDPREDDKENGFEPYALESFSPVVCTTPGSRSTVSVGCYGGNFRLQ